MKWIIAFAKSFSNDKSVAEGVTVGSAVRTSMGTGVVVGGSLNIKYDYAPQGQHPNNRTWSHNLNEVEFL